MQVLAIETSTFGLGIALIKSKPGEVRPQDVEVIFDFFINSGVPESERIIEIINEWVSNPNEIDGFAVSLGPGSFTGLRVGLATIKGLAMGFNKPVIGVPTLDAFAVGFAHTEYKVIPIMDAKMGEVYTATYYQRNKLSDYQNVRLSDYLDSLEEVRPQGEYIFVGNGVRIYSDLIHEKLGKRAHFVYPNLEAPRASWVAAIAIEQIKNGRTDPIDSLEPIYLHPPRIIRK